jgi:lactate permease
LGTPIIVLSDVANINVESISTMAGHQLPILSFIVPLWMVKCMCSWRQTWEVWPALVVAGGSFAIFQFTFATIHEYVSVVLFPMTDIGGGIFSLVVTAIFLNFWKPKKEWHFDKPAADASPLPAAKAECADPHAAAAAALLAADATVSAHETKRLTFGNITLAWMPYILMSVFLMLTGLVRQREVPVKEGPGPIEIVPGLHTNYQVPVPTLHHTVYRDERLLEKGKQSRPESALFNIPWLTAPGTPVFLASLASMVMLRMSVAQVRRVFARTFFQMRIPVPTIAFMLGLSYVTRYAGMDATLGFAFAKTGVLYPFFAALLGWLGVFLTGTDAGSNALFGSLQKITATEIYNSPAAPFSHLSLDQAQVLICTANSTGGVMGKMIDAQSICVATAATHQLGKEADIFKAVVWHSIALAVIVGLITLLQAYLPPFTSLVPQP